jgi:hypothetical protein
LGDFIRGQTPESQFTGTFKDFVDDLVAAKDKITTIFDLADGVKSFQVHGSTFPLGEFGTED